MLILDAGSCDFITLFSFVLITTHSTDDINTNLKCGELFLYAIKVTGSTKQTKIN